MDPKLYTVRVLCLAQKGLFCLTINNPFSGLHAGVYLQKHLLCHPRHASTTVDEHFFLNVTAEQLSRLSRRLPTTAVTIVTGNYHDATLPAELNTAWASAATSLEGRYGARRVVIDGADGSLMYRQSGELVNVLKRLVKTRRAGLEDAEATKASAV